MNNQVTEEVIRRFLEGKSNEAERKLVRNYLKQSKVSLNQIIDDEEEWRDTIGKKLPSGLRVEMWENVSSYIHRNKQKKLRWLAAACIIGLFWGLYALLPQRITKTEQTRFSIAETQKRIIANNGSIAKTFILSDGSKIILEPGSSLYYYDTFRDHRDIFLSGIGYFEVSHDNRHPFKVYANGIGTLALGTHFWVECTGDYIVTVKLLEGKVMVRSFDKQIRMKDIVLDPDEKLTINKQTGVALVSRLIEKSNIVKQKGKSINIKEFEGNTVWTNHAYTFSNATLRKVFNRIESRFHVVIKIKDSEIADYQFTGKILFGDSLSVIMDAICRMNAIKYSKNVDTITVSK